MSQRHRPPKIQDEEDVRNFKVCSRERIGSVVECLTRVRGFEPHWHDYVVVLAQDTFTLALYWFNPGRHGACLTERLLMGCKESNQTNKNKVRSTDYRAVADPEGVQRGFTRTPLPVPCF